MFNYCLPPKLFAVCEKLMISFHQIIVENQAHFAEQVEFYEQYWLYTTDAASGEIPAAGSSAAEEAGAALFFAVGDLLSDSSVAALGLANSSVARRTDFRSGG